MSTPLGGSSYCSRELPKPKCFLPSVLSPYPGVKPMPQSFGFLKHWKLSLVHGRSTRSWEEEALTVKHTPSSQPPASRDHVHSIDLSYHQHRHPSLHVLPNFCFLVLNPRFLRRFQFQFPAVIWMSTQFSFHCQSLQVNSAAKSKRENQQSPTKQGWWGRLVSGLWSQGRAKASKPSLSKTENYRKSWKPWTAVRWPKLRMLNTWKTKKPVFWAQSGTTPRDINQKR